MVKFFHIICKELFEFLLTASEIERKLLRPISNYFVTVKTNEHGILHLHYLI